MLLEHCHRVWPGGTSAAASVDPCRPRLPLVLLSLVLASLSQRARAARLAHRVSGPTWSSPEVTDDDGHTYVSSWDGHIVVHERPVRTPRGHLAMERDDILRQVSVRLSLDLVRMVLDKASFRSRIATWKQGGQSVLVWGPDGRRMKLGNFSPGVRGVQHFPLDDRLLSWTWGGFAIIWDAHTGLPLQELRHARRVADARVFPRGDRVVVCDWGGECTVWLSASGAALVSFSVRNMQDERSGIFRTHVDVFPDGLRLLVRCVDEVRVVSATSGDAACQSSDPRLPLFHASIFPDGDAFIAGTLEDAPNSAIMWHSASCMPSRVLSHFAESIVVDAAVFDGGQLVVTLASLDIEDFLDGAREMVVWDSSTGARLHACGPVQESFSILPVPRSSHVVTVSLSSTAVWDVGTGERLMSLPGDNFHGASVSPGGDVLVTTHEEMGLTVYDLGSAARLGAFNWSADDLEDQGDVEGDWLDPMPVWRCATGVGRTLDPRGFGRGLDWRELS